MAGTMLKVRRIDYPTAKGDVLAPLQGYRVQFTGDGWSVFRYVGARTTLCPEAHGVSEDAAHAAAARMTGTVPHPATYA